MSNLKIGFIVDGDLSDTYTYNLINEILRDGELFAEPTLIIQENDSPKKKLFFSWIFSNFFSIPQKIMIRLIIFIESTRVIASQAHNQHYEKKNLSSLNLNKIRISPIKSKSGSVHKFSETDIKKLYDQQFDVLIRAGTGILKGKILQVARFGVLSFHHGDNRLFRGMPAGFWEVYLRANSSGFIIQQLTEVLDGGNVIYQGNIPTASFWQLNYANLCKKSGFFMLDCLKKISKSQVLPAFKSNQISSEIFKVPSFKILFNYMFKQGALYFYNSFKRFLGYKTRWSIAIGKFNSGNFSVSDTLFIKNQPRRFLADPFLHRHKNRVICFAEEFSYINNKGRIVAFEILNNDYKYLGAVIEEKFHLSFPYIFKIEDEIYMCPESSQNNDIRIYKCENFPQKWSLKKIIFKDISAADSIIFQNKEKWFLLTNICSSHMKEHNSELHLFTSDHPLHSKWVPAKDNPIIFDSLKARNGGFFKIGNQLFRVNQVQKSLGYGSDFEVNMIKEISSEHFIEKQIDLNLTILEKNIKGMHHFHVDNQHCAFDFWMQERVK